MKNNTARRTYSMFILTAFILMCLAPVTLTVYATDPPRILNTSLTDTNAEGQLPGAGTLLKVTAMTNAIPPTEAEYTGSPGTVLGFRNSANVLSAVYDGVSTDINGAGTPKNTVVAYPATGHTAPIRWYFDLKGSYNIAYVKVYFGRYGTATSTYSNISVECSNGGGAWGNAQSVPEFSVLGTAEETLLRTFDMSNVVADMIRLNTTAGNVGIAEVEIYGTPAVASVGQVSSAVYTVGDNTITNVPYSHNDVEIFKSNINLVSGTGFKVFQSDGVTEITDGTIITGCILRAFGEAGNTDYTITVNAALTGNSITATDARIVITDETDPDSGAEIGTILIKLPNGPSDYTNNLELRSTVTNLLIFPQGATYQWYNRSNNVATANNMTSGFTLRVTAEGASTPRIYTLDYTPYIEAPTLTFYDSQNVPVQDLVSNGFADGTVVVRNYSKDRISLQLTMAVYDNEGKLISVAASIPTLNNNTGRNGGIINQRETNKTLCTSALDTERHQLPANISGYTVKLFLWDSFEGLIPLPGSPVVKEAPQQP